MYRLSYLFVYLRNFKKVNSLFIFLLKNKKEAQNYFFFPAYHLGGAEKIHLQIIKNFPKEKNVVFFTYNSNNDFFLRDFKQYSNIYQLPNNIYNDSSLKSLFIKIFIIFFREKINAFGCNNTIFYEIINFTNNKNIYKIDLLHAFSFPDSGIENVSIKFVNKIDRRIVINRKTKEDYISQYKKYNISESYIDRIEVIENGVHINPLISKDFKKKLQILFSGRNSQEKRPNIFFEIAKKIPDSSFHIAGDDFRNYEDHPNVTKYGKLNENKIEELYKENNILLITSYREGFPLVVMEAMSNGIVCICTNVGSIRDHIIDGINGFVIDNSENECQIIDNFVDRIKQLDENRILLEKMSNNAYLYAKQHFDINVFNEKYKKLLKSY